MYFSLRVRANFFVASIWIRESKFQDTLFPKKKKSPQNYICLSYFYRINANPSIDGLNFDLIVTTLTYDTSPRSQYVLDY